MVRGKSKEQFIQEASLSQKVAAYYPEYSDYAGSDPQISESIAILNFCAYFDLFDEEDQGFQMMKGLLNEIRKARFATSDRVNEITKLGFHLPKKEARYGGRRRADT